MATVPRMTKKVSGTSRSASVSPRSPNWKAKLAETAAATIPRGANQARNARSVRGNPDRIVLRTTVSGRAPTIKTARNASSLTPRRSCNWSDVRRADKIMNKKPIESVRNSSLNAMIFPTGNDVLIRQDDDHQCDRQKP